MFERLLTIKYITSKNCFCYLSANNSRDLDGNTLQLSYGNGKIAYVSMDHPNVSVDDKTVGISSLYAKALGINDEEEVVLTEIVKPPTIKSLTISPKTSADYEVIEMLADTIQSTLLDQIRVLHNGQDIVIWIGNTMHVSVHAYDIHPISPGRIDNFTEVVIKPPRRHSRTDSVRRQSIPNAKTSKFSKYLERKNDLVLRIVPINNVNIASQFVYPFNMFVSNKDLNISVDTVKNPQIYRGKLLEQNDEVKCVYVRLFAIDDVVKDFQSGCLSDDNVFVSDAIFDFFNCKIGTRILLEPCIEPCPNVEEVEICCKRNFSLNIEEIFKNYLGEIHQPFVLNSKVVFEVSPSLRCKLNFLPGHSDFRVIDSDFVRNCKFSVVSETLPDATSKKDLGQRCCTNVANYEEIVRRAVFVLVQNKLRIDSKWDNVLITGSSGSGKSTLLGIIENELESFPYYVYTRKIDCKSIKGKTIDSLHKMFNGVMFDLMHHQPAVLIIDDLHILCEHVNESDALAQNALYFNRISEMLEGLFQTFAEHNLFGILATAESTTKLNKNMYATRGNHLFKHVHAINNLEKKDRRILLEYFFSKHNVDNVDFDKLTEKTESFVVRDLADFANKSSFESYQEDYESKIPKLTDEHCDRALENTVITSLDGINLHPPGTKDFNDIGGLDEVKTILVETMLWPSKYPSLFSKSPLRLPSGLLLYGPPGTGKTILAGAAARHCGLRLISIKGPELLSKYIGASEQAVRDVFQRAQSAKPCVLFFDEFDSLAPRRGHDNTGVTDRVVNQLLTQLDGVETLTGVFVLAATSRPDLLDPALLRPGRLDRHIRCSVPDGASRLDILRVLSRTMNLAENVDLSKIAADSEGFSGADLQSVLYSAQLASVDDLLSDDKASSDEVESVITQDKLEEALSKTKPSLSKQEKMKYDNIYRKFEGGGVDNFKAGSRATLA